MRYLYSALLYLLQPILLLRLLWRGRREPGYRQRIGERYGWIDSSGADHPAIWVHAVSLGETQAAAPMVEALLREHPGHRLVVTSTTPTGSGRVQALFGERVLHCYAPWDLPGSVARFLRRIKPRLLVLMETELWPNTIHQCHQAGCRVVLANARLSQRSADGYARVPSLTRAMLGKLDRVACQSAADGERLVALGLPARALEVTGSIKFDVTFDASQREDARQLRSACRSGERPVLLAASTHRGEDELVLDAFDQLRAYRDDALLMLIPRHPQRVADVEALCRARSWRVVRRSSGRSPGCDHDVVLGDTVGELAVLQSAATIAVIGGSLVPEGGHNPLEAAAWGVPLVCGPHMENFSAICGQLVEAGAMIQVTSGELAPIICDLSRDSTRRESMGAAGLQVVEANRGALARLLALIESELEV
jgi:3-deoxy-D-manno-octulosonic-acid transferase